MINYVGLKGLTKPPPRMHTGFGEFDRVCGGGLVKGSVILLAGDPGIGKSTLLLQVAAAMAPARVVYITGEETVGQVRLRAERLNVTNAPVMLAEVSDVREIVTSLNQTNTPKLVIIDSIQTMQLPTLSAVAGSIKQVTYCAQALTEVTRRQGLTLILVCHVTHAKSIAGPMRLEHMVDTVLFFEKGGGQQRALKVVKNRFGSTEEVGRFMMGPQGLVAMAQSARLNIQLIA